MNKFKSTFSIKDLENLSGIKAHTIRIWEKRHNLLQPKRTDTNIRYYDLEGLQTLLNVSFLNAHGYKISKIAALSNKHKTDLIKEISKDIQSDDHVHNLFKLAMLNFDQHLFNTTFEKLAKTKSFREIFHDVFIPLLCEIGLLWQTDTITPAHEHFISTLVRQKIVLATEKLQAETQVASQNTFVLFLPDNEIHEIGLMYLNLEIVSKGQHTIMLGQSVPMESLLDVLNHYEHLIFVSYFTIQPDKDHILQYLEDFEKLILAKEHTKFWILGRMTEFVDPKRLPSSIQTFASISALVAEI